MFKFSFLILIFLGSCVKSNYLKETIKGGYDVTFTNTASSIMSRNLTYVSDSMEILSFPEMHNFTCFSELTYGKVFEKLTSPNNLILTKEEFEARALMLASSNGDSEIVKFLLEKLSADEIGKYGKQLILSESQNGNLENLKLLLEKCPNLISNNNTSNVVTPLHFASMKGHLEVVKFFIDEKKLNVDKMDSYGVTALMLASHNGHENIVEFLLQKGAKDIDAEQKIKYSYSAVTYDFQDGYMGYDPVYVFAKNKMSAFHAASQNGHTEIVKKLFKIKSEMIDIVDGGWTALHFASMNGHKDIVEFLLEKGAKINSATSNDWTALSLASLNGHESIVKLLLKDKEISTYSENKEVFPLYAASLNGHIKIVEILLERDANINRETKNGNIALHAASKGGHKKLVEYLIDKGANLDGVTKDGWTALHFASLNGKANVVEFLLSKEAEIKNTKDLDSPLGLAIQSGNKEIIDLLLPTANYFKDALLNSIFLGHLEFFKLIVDSKNCNIARLGYSGDLLLWAIEHGYIEIAKLLINKGANGINFSNNNLTTPLMLASAKGYKDIVELLLKLKDIDANQKNNYSYSEFEYDVQKNGHIEYDYDKYQAWTILTEADLNSELRDTNRNNFLSIFEIAVLKGNKDLIEILLDNNVSKTSNEYIFWEAILRACSEDEEDLMNLLLDLVPGVEKKDSWKAVIKNLCHGSNKEKLSVNVYALLESRGIKRDSIGIKQIKSSSEKDRAIEILRETIYHLEENDIQFDFEKMPFRLKLEKLEEFNKYFDIELIESEKKKYLDKLKDNISKNMKKGDENETVISPNLNVPEVNDLPSHNYLAVRQSCTYLNDSSPKIPNISFFQTSSVEVRENYLNKMFLCPDLGKNIYVSFVEVGAKDKNITLDSDLSIKSQLVLGLYNITTSSNIKNIFQHSEAMFATYDVIKFDSNKFFVFCKERESSLISLKVYEVNDGSLKLDRSQELDLPNNIEISSIKHFKNMFFIGYEIDNNFEIVLLDARDFNNLDRIKVSESFQGKVYSRQLEINENKNQLVAIYDYALPNIDKFSTYTKIYSIGSDNLTKLGKVMKISENTSNERNKHIIKYIPELEIFTHVYGNGSEYYLRTLSVNNFSELISSAPHLFSKKSETDTIKSCNYLETDKKNNEGILRIAHTCFNVTKISDIGIKLSNKEDMSNTESCQIPKIEVPNEKDSPSPSYLSNNDGFASGLIGGFISGIVGGFIATLYKMRNNLNRNRVVVNMQNHPVRGR